MWFAIALNDINDIPAGTLLKITEFSKVRKRMVVESISDVSVGRRVVMHQPAWWLRNIGISRELLGV